MTAVNIKYDFYHVLFNPFFNAANSLIPYVTKTILIELHGIKIAAIKGDNVPCTAKYNPITLYKIDNTKLKSATK